MAKRKYDPRDSYQMGPPLYGPGYPDPLSRGYPGMGGMNFGPQALGVRPGDYIRGGSAYSMAPPPSAPSTGGSGGVLQGVGRWIRNPDNLTALANLAGTGAYIYGAAKDRSMWEEEMERQRKREEEDRANRRKYGPITGAIIANMAKSINNGSGG